MTIHYVQTSVRVVGHPPYKDTKEHTEEDNMDDSTECSSGFTPPFHQALANILGLRDPTQDCDDVADADLEHLYDKCEDDLPPRSRSAYDRTENPEIWIKTYYTERMQGVSDRVARKKAKVASRRWWEKKRVIPVRSFRAEWKDVFRSFRAECKKACPDLSVLPAWASRIIQDGIEDHILAYLSTDPRTRRTGKRSQIRTY